MQKLSDKLQQESTNHHFYIAGSKQQVAETKNALLKQGIDENMIFSETL